ncbi:hypothetical protein EJB05_45911, partial [Eragrostis curvula]
MALPLLLLVLLSLGARAQQQKSSAAATLHERDAAALRDLRARLRDLPGSRFFDSWDDAGFKSKEIGWIRYFRALIAAKFLYSGTY